MLVGHICSYRQHPRPHKLVGGVGLFTPEYIGQSGKTFVEKTAENAGVIGVKLEVTVYGSGSVANVDAGNRSRLHNAAALQPNLIEQLVHERESVRSIASRQLLPNAIVLACENIIPHFHHWIGRRGDDQINRLIRDSCHGLGRATYQFSGGLHLFYLSVCSADRTLF